MNGIEDRAIQQNYHAPTIETSRSEFAHIAVLSKTGKGAEQMRNSKGTNISKTGTYESFLVSDSYSLRLATEHPED